MCENLFPEILHAIQVARLAHLAAFTVRLRSFGKIHCVRLVPVTCESSTTLRAATLVSAAVWITLTFHTRAKLLLARLFEKFCLNLEQPLVKMFRDMFKLRSSGGVVYGRYSVVWRSGAGCLFLLRVRVHGLSISEMTRERLSSPSRLYWQVADRSETTRSTIDVEGVFMCALAAV